MLTCLEQVWDAINLCILNKIFSQDLCFPSSPSPLLLPTLLLHLKQTRQRLTEKILFHGWTFNCHLVSSLDVRSGDTRIKRGSKSNFFLKFSFEKLCCSCCITDSCETKKDVGRDLNKSLVLFLLKFTFSFLFWFFFILYLYLRRCLMVSCELSLLPILSFRC